MTTGTTDSPDEHGHTAAAGISERFLAAAAEHTRRVDAVELLPSALVDAAVEVSTADAAGLSVMSREFRVLLGASTVEAAAIERLQFTAEQGPCWDAIRADLPLAADQDLIAAQWPLFAEEMHRSTSFRSVVSVPVRLARGTGGALDLYFDDPSGASRFILSDGTVMAAHIADHLNQADGSNRPPDLHGVVGPAWARGASARTRLAVWIAVGMVLADAATLPADALAVLRARAYSTGRTLDDIAADVVAGRINVTDLFTS